MEVLLSGAEAPQDIILEETVQDSIEFLGQVIRYRLPNTAKKREILVQREGDVTIEFISEYETDSFILYNTWESRVFTLDANTDYWVDVRQFDGCASYNADALPLNYTFVIRDIVGSTLPSAAVGETIICPVEALGDYCDYSLNILPAQIGFPLSFFASPESQEESNSHVNLVELWYDGELENSARCYNGQILQSLDDFRPENAGSYTLRVREQATTSYNAQFLGNISVTLGPSPLDATELPLDTVAQNTWTHPASIAWYRVTDVARGDTLAIEVSGYATSGYARIEIFSDTGISLSNALYYENQAASIQDFSVTVEGPILIAYQAGYSRTCEGNVDESWEALVGLEFSIAVWKQPERDLSTFLTTAIPVDYGSSFVCERANVADFCQYRLSISPENIGLPLWLVVHDTETSFPSIRSELEILERGQSVFSRRCFGDDEIWTQGEYVPQSVGDIEIRVTADYDANFTLTIGENPFESFIPLNNDTDREMNFTNTFNGTFPQLIGFTFEANAGDLVSVDFKDCCPRASLARLPGGRLVVQSSYNGFDSFVIPHTGSYAIYVTRGYLGTCNNAGYIAENENVTVTISKVSGGDDDSLTVPAPEPLAGQVLDSIVSFSCDVNSTVFRSCAFTVFLPDELANGPLSFFMTHPENDMWYASQVRVFHQEDYPSGSDVLIDYRSCTTSAEYVAYSMGGYSLPRGGVYVVQLQTYGNQAVDLELDLLIGVNNKTNNAVGDGDMVFGEINSGESWALIQVDVPDDDSFVTLDLVEGLGWIILFDPKGSIVGQDSDTLDVLTKYRGVYTAIVTATGSQYSTCSSPGLTESNFTLAVAMRPAYPDLDSLPTVSFGSIFECLMSTPFEKCMYKIEITPSELGTPYSIYPEILSLGNHSSDRDSSSVFQLQTRIFRREDFPVYEAFSDSSCSSYEPCSASSCISTGIVGEIIFDRAGAYILEIGNGYWQSRRKLAGHVALTMSPALVQVVDLSEGSASVEGNFTDRQSTVFALEGIASDVLIDRLDIDVLNYYYLRLFWSTEALSASSSSTNLVLDAERATDNTALVVWQDYPRACRNQESTSWLSDEVLSYSIRLTAYEETPLLPLPSISFGDEVLCTISSPAMYCAYEWEATDEHVNTILPIYFDAPNTTLGEGEYWRTAVFISNVEEYPDRSTFSDWNTNIDYAWYSQWLTVPRPGKYVVRIGNSRYSGQRGTGTVRVHWGKGNLQSFNEVPVPFNEELLGVVPFVETYLFEVKQGDHIAVDLIAPIRKNMRIVDCNGDVVGFQDSVVNGGLFEARNSGKHLIVVQPYYYAVIEETEWESAAAEPYSLILHESNPFPAAADRFLLVQGGQLDFECLVDRAWGYCTFELQVTEEIVGNSISVLVSNVQNTTDRYELVESWDTQVLVDQNDYEDWVSDERSYCNDKTFRSRGVAPQAPGRYTFRIGNFNHLATGAFEVSFSNIWQPQQQPIALGETTGGSFGRWADIHSFLVSATGANYRITVTVASGTEVRLVSWSVSSPTSRSITQGEGTIVRNIYSPSEPVALEISPRFTTDGSCEDLDTITGAIPPAYNFTVTITANP